MEEQSHVQVFISYASQDQERVLPVYDYLVKNGYPNTWIDCKKLLPGQPWEFEIERNLRKSEIVLIFLSHNSINKRGFVQKELKTCLRYLEEKLNSDIYIVPIKLDTEVALPEELSKLQWLELERHDALILLKASLDTQTEKLGFEILSGELYSTEIHTTKKNISEKWDGLPGYEVELSLPVFHSTTFENIHEVTKIIEGQFIKSLHTYRLNKLEQTPGVFSWAQFYYQRTNTFFAHYDNIFHNNNFLSILYRISWYAAGAAHPNYHFESFNFLLTPLIEIEDLRTIFTDESSAFGLIQEYVRKTLGELKVEKFESDSIENERMLEEEWVNQGTDCWESFSVFGFSKEGLIIYFAPYQVGPYAFGDHTVTIPYDIFYRHLKFDYRHALSLSPYD
jgi:hypothetical protein